MPTRAEVPHQNLHSYEHAPCWTDDLPVCRQSGVGSSTNLLYREDGARQEEHPNEDRSFHVHLDKTYLYAVFDGFEGGDAAQFALQRMAYEILLGQLEGKTTDEEIKEVLRQAFINVEKSYMESIDDRLAERAKLQMDIPDDLSDYEAYRQCPYLIDRLKTLNYELSCGTTAVVALVYEGRLYVANVGECRALLCRSDKDGVLRVLQLSVDHSLANEDEILRLSHLGLNIEKLKQEHHLGGQENTRCLGNYLVKGGYKEFEELSCAVSEPVIAEPEIHGGIPLDESCRFLMLMSDGVYKSLESALQTDQVNRELTQMVVTEFRNQSSLTGVAQAVVDKIGRIHQDVYISNNISREGDSAPAGGRKGHRDDMTLLIRNFNYDIPNALHSPSVMPSTRLKPVQLSEADRWLNSGISGAIDSNESGNSYDYPRNAAWSSITGSGIETTLSSTNDSTATEQSTSDPSLSQVVSAPQQAPILPYVDFSEYYANVEHARIEGTLPEGINF